MDTLIIDPVHSRYSADPDPERNPPQGWQRVDKSVVKSDYIYTPFVWIDEKGNPVNGIHPETITNRR